MKLLAFAGSNSKKTINGQLIRYAVSLIKGAEVEILDLNDFEMPLFSVDREDEWGIPELAHRFYDKIGATDALLVSLAEHNGSYTVAFKNLFDWTSRIDGKVYQGKPLVLLATSPGARGASGVLATAVNSAPHFGADLKGSLSIPGFNKNFDTTTGKITNPEIQAELKATLGSLFELGQDSTTK
jgi:NAD(P)H-dependent FMN reductase